MRLLFICQAASPIDPIQAGTLRWIELFAARPEVEHLTVLALRGEGYEPPAGVRLHAIGHRRRAVTLFRFYRETLRALREGVDAFFIYQGGPYPALLLPLKWLLRIPIYQWKAHPHVSLPMRFYARFCDDAIFTSTAGAFPYDSGNVHVVGQGIDTDFFRPMGVPKAADLVSVGRISPVKGLDRVLEGLALCNRRHGAEYRLHLVGPTLDADRGYRQELERMIRRLGLDGLVEFVGTVAREEMPAVLNRYRAYISASGGAMDRAVVEAMACGLPVVSTNACTAEALPHELARGRVVPDGGSEELARGIHSVLSLGDGELDRLGDRYRQLVQRDHRDETLIGRIVSAMDRGP